MKFYLLEKPDWFTGEIDILRFHQGVNYQDFADNRMYRLPKRLMLYTKNKEYGEYPDILLDPLPLFSENMWMSILQFMDEPLHTHFILMEEKTGQARHYYSPDFKRIKGRVIRNKEEGERTTASLLLEGNVPENVPILYLEEARRIWVMVQLDIAESFIRRGLCDVKLFPVDKEVIENGIYQF